MVMAADELNKQLQLDKNTALSKDKPGKTLKVVFSISRYDKGKVNSGLRKKRGVFYVGSSHSSEMLQYYTCIVQVGFVLWQYCW